MNVVVVIEGREAIPVRAIPLLTDWQVLSPDELAVALSGNHPHNTSFGKLTAYRLENGHLKDVKPRWWSNFPVRQLEALSHRIKHKQISHDDGYEQWRYKSLPILPSGVFVWKDEFEACFWSAYGPDGEIDLVKAVRGPDREFEYGPDGEIKLVDLKHCIKLDFEPFALPELLASVMEGFELPATTPGPTSEPKAAPVVPSWDKLPMIRVVDAGYLLAGMEPERRWQSAPPLVVNFFNLICKKTGAVKLATSPGERMEISQAEFQALKAEYGVASSIEPKAAPVAVAVPEPQAATPSPATTPAPPMAVQEIAFDMVATRQQLIDAFGAFTGMNWAWFDNLSDSPKLKAARKYAGQGGRHRAEPLFCPYEVMQWLADPKRKKGKPLNKTTAWRLLKSHFPKVHNQYSIGDPNAD